MTRFYCTLFDYQYLSRGLALHHSLSSKSTKPIHIYILAMDEDCYRALSKLELKDTTILNLEKDFMNATLNLARSNRSWSEFCWTCSSALIKFVLEIKKVPQVTYLDSDIYFFNDPEQLFLEFNEQNSAQITDHHYYKNHDQSATSGQFCVQFLTFNNNEKGKLVLKKWHEQCLDDCSLNPEKGICGDQKYLDTWPNEFLHVKICTHLGAGLAPWNVEKYILQKSINLKIIDGSKKYPVVFYHFQGLRVFDSHWVQASGDRYQISNFIYKNIYIPYFKQLSQIAFELSIKKEIATHAVQKDTSIKIRFFNPIKAFLRRNYNIPLKVKDIFFQPCPLCFGSNLSIKHQGLYDDRYAYPGYFDLIVCEDCKHSYLRNNFKSKDFTELYTQYYPRASMSPDQFIPTQLLGGFKGWFINEKSAAFTQVPEKSKVLDVGCGFGYSVEYHQRRGSIAVGIDADENVKKIADKFKLDIRIGVFNPEMLKNEKFDYITLEQVLEHSQDPVKFIQDLKSHLTDDGKIIISIPNAFGFGARIFGKKWIHWHTPYHLQFFSNRSLNKLVEKSTGLEIEKIIHKTHSHWIFYQVLALLTYPKQAKKSIFWTSGTFSFNQKIIRKTLGIALKLGIFSIYTKILDALHLGDNRIIIIKKKNH